MNKNIPFLFPIARPAALALLVRLPFLPKRKPVIVPSLFLAHALARVAAPNLLSAYRLAF